MSIKVDTMLFELAKLRVLQNEAHQNVAEVDERIKCLPEIIEREAKQLTEKSILEQIAGLEKDLREVALEEYAINKHKDLGGVQIKIFTSLEYDENIAVNYCLEHKHNTLLKLDKRGFEKVAKELKPEFVTVKEEPRAQIATDLSEYL